MRKQRKTFCTFMAVILILCLVLPFYGCAIQRSTPKHTLKIAINIGPEADALRSLSSAYERENNIKIDFKEFPYMLLYKEIGEDLERETAQYDVVFLDDPWLPEYASKGYLTPLEELSVKFKDSLNLADFFHKSIKVCLWVPPEKSETFSSLYALPMVGNVQLFFYRKDLFQSKNLPPPQTWDNVIKAAQKLNRPEENCYGFVHRCQRNLMVGGNPLVTDWLAILWSFGGDIFNQKGKVIINSSQSVEALQFFLKLLNYSPPGIEGYGDNEVGESLAKNMAAMAIVWPSGWATMMDDPRRSSVVNNIEFAIVPRKIKHAPVLGNWLLGIPRNAKNKALALKFILWATNADNQRLYGQFGGVPTRRSVLTDVSLTLTYRHYQAILESMELAISRPRLPQWVKIEDILGKYLFLAVTGKLSAEEALDKAAQEIKEVDLP